MKLSSVLLPELSLAINLAKRAGDITLQYFRTGLAVGHKAGDEPVTEADRASQALIIAGLREQFPEDGILAEELEDNTSWSLHRRSWVIDPLDGTKDYIAGREGFSVMIGLLEEARPILGVVHQPTTGLTFWARKGGGCYMQRGSETTPLWTSTVQKLSSLRLVASKSHRTVEIDEAKKALGITDEQNVGSVGLKISLIVRGERDLYLNPQGHSKLWDACAPEIILAEGGGRMTDLFGDPICYAPDEIRLKRGIVATNGHCHEAVLQAIAPLFPKE